MAEKMEKKPVSIRLTYETKDKLQQVLEKYKREDDEKQDQQELALMRILEIADNDVVRGTHPELESSLKDVDKTIATLIKQINGIVSGQDNIIFGLRKDNQDIAEKLEKIEASAKERVESANIRTARADELIAVAEEKAKQTKEQAEKEIDSAIKERDAAIKGRLDAEELAKEKTANNEFLLKQVAELKKEAEEYKKMQNQFLELKEELKEKEREIKEIEKEAIQKAETEKAVAELKKEQAVIEIERKLRKEYQEQLRTADREIAVLKAKLGEK